MSRSPRLDLPYIMPSQAQKHVTHNEAIERLDALTHIAVEDLAASTVPTAPEEGDAYGVGPAPGGAWTAQTGKLAFFYAGGWIFQTPQDGMLVWDKSQGRLMAYSQGDWATVSSDGFSQIGVNATADTTNRLSVSSPATLLSHEGAGHQLKINKAGSGETASLVFQNNWSGHAEMGLAGDNDWAIKVSPDGSTWTDALKFDATNGSATGAAVQAAADDATAGKLLKLNGNQGAFGLGGAQALDAADLDAIAVAGLYRTTNASVGGPVSGWGHSIWHTQFDASNATQLFVSSESNEAFMRRKRLGVWQPWCGLVPETGTNANGTYTRFADGTQICHFRTTVQPIANDVTQTAFTFPATFSFTGASATDEIAVVATANTTVPETRVGPTGYTLDDGTTGTLYTYRTNTTTTYYSCIAIGRWA